MKLVIDTNVIIASLSSKSKYHWIIQWLREGKFQLAVTTEIFLEYEEKLKEKYNPIVASSFLNALKELENVNNVAIYTNWGLIKEDPDDNKFVDCAIASNASFIITNDRHFNILKSIDFPKLSIMSIEEFSQYSEGILIQQEIVRETYKIVVSENGIRIFCEECQSGYYIDKWTLKETRLENNTNCSNIILHLTNKTWIENKANILYEIAQIIQSSFPFNEINWLATFTIIKYLDYLEHLNKIRSQKEGLNLAFDFLKLAIEEASQEELIKFLEQGIAHDLKKRKII